MANIPVMVNSYVKFVRTNKALWNNIKAKDPDTLYFIIENDSDNGELYLGDVLIASSIPTSFTLNDLENVSVSDVKEGQVLVANASGDWINRDLNDYMPKQMVGATQDEDGQAGLVTIPVAGQQNLYLQGNGSWSNPTAALETTVGKLSEKANALEDSIDAINGTDAGKSMRAVAAEVVSSIVDGAPETFDTLKEIAEWIAGADGEVAMDAEALIADVGTLKTTVYGAEGDEKSGLVSRVGVLETTVGDLLEGVQLLEDKIPLMEKDIEDNAANIATNATAIEQLWDALKWNELVDETTIV